MESKTLSTDTIQRLREARLNPLEIFGSLIRLVQESGGEDANVVFTYDTHEGEDPPLYTPEIVFRIQRFQEPEDG